MEEAAPKPGADAKELAGVERDHYDSAREEIGAVAEAAKDGTLTGEALRGAAGALKQAPLSAVAARDALHVPEDAGELADALEALLIGCVVFPQLKSVANTSVFDAAGVTKPFRAGETAGGAVPDLAFSGL